MASMDWPVGPVVRAGYGPIFLNDPWLCHIFGPVSLNPRTMRVWPVGSAGYPQPNQLTLDSGGQAIFTRSDFFVSKELLKSSWELPITQQSTSGPLAAYLPGWGWGDCRRWHYCDTTKCDFLMILHSIGSPSFNVAIIGNLDGALSTQIEREFFSESKQKQATPSCLFSS
ncbi:hypothetical protein JHK82_019060 [Glycine max]|nr:hypothetical protein JHK85_019499 [Glycine max]KAG5143365.1 hypothetical protein JHK82_019060 [Glycine max]